MRISSLAKMLFVDRHRTKMHDKGGLKTPMLMNLPIPAEFEWVCITLLSGDLHMVRVKPDRPTKTGFFSLDLESEDELQGKLVEYLFQRGLERQWGGTSTISLPDAQVIASVKAYFESYDLPCVQGFVGLIGFAALVTAGTITTPEEVEDVGQISHETLEAWMDTYHHVAKIDDVSLHYNSHLSDNIVFTTVPDSVGLMTRMRDHVSLLIHNAERGMVILKVKLVGAAP